MYNVHVPVKLDWLRRNRPGAKSLVQKSRFRESDPTDGLKAEAQAILSYPRAGMVIPLGEVGTRLRKMKGVKEVAINHVCHTVRIHYDPGIVTMEEIRTFLRRR